LLKSALVAEGEERRRWVRYWWEVLDTVVDVLVVDVPGLGLVTTQTARKHVEAGKRAEVASAAGGAELVFDHFSCYFPGLIYMSLQLTEADGPPELRSRAARSCSRLHAA
jgi:hypothetical protein